jgi:hypothetical protein
VAKILSARFLPNFIRSLRHQISQIFIHTKEQARALNPYLTIFWLLNGSNISFRRFSTNKSEKPNMTGYRK